MFRCQGADPAGFSESSRPGVSISETAPVARYAGHVWRLVVVVVVAGCDVTLSEMDNVYSHGMDHAVLCSMNVDNKNLISADSIAVGLDRAQVDGTILHLYSHKPAGTVDESTIDSILASAADRSLGFITYREMLDGVTTPGLALSFDDHDIVGWTGLRALFDLYGAKVTFFVSSFHVLAPEERQGLHDLAADGHDIEYHSTNHENAQDYEAGFGAAAYIDADIRPDLALMRADGFDPRVFAYPFGARSAATDAALLEIFPLLRASEFRCPH